ncbi:MAG: hypothetical protein JWP91_1507 [Fibrobacteres bacterium]|nr:hypothetical protein [Fibrobacterota bacterium]
MEILVGISILLLVMAGVSAYYRNNSVAARQSNAFYYSTTLAASGVERAEGLLSNPDSLKALLDAISDSSYTRNTSVNKYGKTFAMALRFRKVAAPSRLLRISATVTWDGGMRNSLGTVHPYEP